MPADEGPYRASVPLTRLIPRDRRWVRVAAAGALGLVVGAVGYHEVEERRAALDAQAGLLGSRRIGPVTLEGPGATITLPMTTPVVVHVWLQGCADCAPAFEAIQALEAKGGLRVDVPVVNVAYGEATPVWATAHGVGHNLVFDRGGTAIVKPLGIGTFTTVVLDEKGRVRLLDSPVLPGYADRVLGATRALTLGSATMPGLPHTTDDPLHGEFSLREATQGIPGSGALVATIDTSMGAIRCTLYDDKAPITVANFIGLATGARPWKDPKTGQWVHERAYDGTTFHRIIKGFVIQGGDPKGDGTGEPGYVIRDEWWPGATHDAPGLLCAANRGPNTNGAQFFITDAGGPGVKHLDESRSYTIFGECTPLETIHAIAAVETTHPQDRPKEPVVIKTVTIRREKP
jgi:peptidyl-prolyl cis-trans isomerase A (cyclophilin A)